MTTTVGTWLSGIVVRGGGARLTIGAPVGAAAGVALDGVDVRTGAATPVTCEPAGLAADSG